MSVRLYSLFFKRIFDFLLSVLLLIVLSPLLLFVLILLFIKQKKAFFVQARPGINGEMFNLIKFKTMNDRIDQQGKLLPDKDRLMRTGIFLRKTSLDELPQLFNVLKGDMSLVGPRPLLVKYLPLYSAEQARRHELRPGITGWTQVNGRNTLSWDEKFKLDTWYVDNISFLLDVKILWLTFMKVLKREGINAQDATTMKPFTGNG